MRKTWVAAGGVLLAVLAGSGPASASNDDVEPEHTESFNDGEQGYLSLTIPVTLRSETGEEIPGKVSGDCEFTTAGVPNTSDTMVSVLAHAVSTATSAGVPVATGVTCEVLNRHGGVTVDRAAPLATVARPGSSVVRYGAFTICLRVSALYDTNDLVTSKQVCARP